MFTCHEKNYGRGKRFENREQGRSKSSQDNWHDDKIRREKGEEYPSYDNFRKQREEENVSRNTYKYRNSNYSNRNESEWMEWKERVTEEVLVPRKENEFENPSSKLVLQAENKNDKVVGLCHNNEKLEGVRVVSPRCKLIKIQKVSVTKVKEGGKQVKDEDTREGFKANKECACDKDKAMKIKEEEVYHKGRKSKFRDNVD
ncbi:hypothetical protein E3N88_38507 [Mikania micrantha]|uniref:Btz domain-containing protein n=1 Tax=Mikania micrantha TaxID=192012 RepID=A0A5N6LUH3_9ASTR|nr:hypothetical protein E3N88_38507 [Mikania micrantha]